MACPTCAMIRGLLMASGVAEATSQEVAYSPPVKRVDRAVKRTAKRAVSKYHKEFGKQLKKLKRLHPRTAVKNLMKRAHTATKKAMKRR